MCCAPTAAFVLEPKPELLPIDNSYAYDSLAEATIAPFREQMAKEMETVIGYANKKLVKGQGESQLGNFVADAILAQSRINYPDKIHLSVMNNGGIRAPIPQGSIKVATIYELMPFENSLTILELNGVQTKSLFNLLANDEGLSIANSVVLIADYKPIKIFIDGEANYVLAVSDYLAQGNVGMDFLKEAKTLASMDVKIRDMIIGHIKTLEAHGVKVDADIEGRVKTIP
jgi:2',3'-cyclic-nucleotide 2'-phosphodiesterase (5'-nucleotidase family)